MTHKHKGLIYTLKKLDSKGKASKALRMQVLRCVLAVGFALSPWMGGEAYAAGIERIDGVTLPGGLEKTYLQNSSDVAHIYAEQASGTVGLNRFKTFNVLDGQTANLYFQTKQGATFDTLVNTVQNQISISGTVNAIKNNVVGGKLCFISPNGMVVGSSGIINAGALTVISSAINDITDPDDAADVIRDGYRTLNSNAIEIHGQINTATGIDLRSLSIEISKVSGSTITPYLKTGMVFNTVVNTTGTEKLVEKVELIDQRSNSGDQGIRLQAYVPAGGDNEYKQFGDITLSGCDVDALGDINIISGNSVNINNNTNIKSNNNIEFDLEHDEGGRSVGDVNFNSGKIEAEGLVKMTVGNSITIEKDAKIISGISKSESNPDDKAKLVTQIGNITNNSIIIANSSLDIQAGANGSNIPPISDLASIINSGTIQSTNGGMSLTADRLLTNTGKIQATSEVKFIVGGTLTNKGEIKSTSSNVQTHVGRNFYNVGGTAAEGLQRGLIEAGGNVQIDYTLPDTMSVATKENDEAATPYGIYNSGTIESKGEVDPKYDDNGKITDSGSGNIWLTSSYNITNYGDMKANRQITLNARDFLHNYGLIQGVTYLDIKSIMGYVYNHGFDEDGTAMNQPGRIIATGGNIDLSSGQANLQIKDDKDGQKKELYRKFTPIIIEGLVEATSDDDKSNQTREGNIKITAYLGDIYVNGGTIKTKAEKSETGEVMAEAGDVILDAAQNITIGFETKPASADDPTTDAEDNREYFIPKKDTSGKLVNGTAVKIVGSNITLISGSEETNTVSMSEASSKIRLISDRGAKTISMSEVNNTLTASNAVAIYTDSMNIVGGTINAGALAASNNLNIEGGSITTNSITAGNELNVTGGNVSSNGSLELNGGGNVNIGFGASVKANNDIALTSSSAGVNASSITLGGSLQLQGNNIDVNNIQRSGDQTKPLNVKANGIGETDSAIENLTLNITGDASFDSLNVTNANVTTSGTLEIAELKVEEKAQLTSKAGGTPNSVDIYGKNATPEAGSGDVIRDTGDFVTIKIDDKGYEATVVGNNDNEDAVRLSTKLVDYDPYETYAEHYGDVADLFGRSDLIEASERPEGEAAKDDGKAVLKQDEKGLRIVKQRKHN